MLDQMIATLENERERLTVAIRALENVAAVSGSSTKRRGRKSMNAAERREVSARMRRYWAKRRRSGGE